MCEDTSLRIQIYNGQFVFWHRYRYICVFPRASALFHTPQASSFRRCRPRRRSAFSTTISSSSGWPTSATFSCACRRTACCETAPPSGECVSAGAEIHEDRPVTIPRVFVCRFKSKAAHSIACSWVVLQMFLDFCFDFSSSSVWISRLCLSLSLFFSLSLSLSISFLVVVSSLVASCIVRRAFLTRGDVAEMEDIADEVAASLATESATPLEVRQHARTHTLTLSRVLTL